MASKGKLSITTTSPKKPVAKNVHLLDLLYIDEEERSTKRPRRESMGEGAKPDEGTATRLLRKLGATVSKIAAEMKVAQVLVTKNPNTKLEIKTSIGKLASLTSIINTNDMRMLMEEGTMGEVTPACREVAIEDEKEREFSEVHRKLDILIDRVKILEAGQQRLRETKGGGDKKKDKDGKTQTGQTSKGGTSTAGPNEKGRSMAEIVAGSKAKPLERQDSERERKDEGWKQQRNQRKGNSVEPKPTRILVSTEGSTYSKTLTKLQEEIKPERASDVTRAWRSRDGNMVVEVKVGGDDRELMKAIGQVMGNDKARPTKGSTRTLEVKDIPEGFTVEKVAEVIATTTEQKGTYSVRWIRNYGKDFRIAMVECNREDAAKLLERRVLRIGWTQCRIQERQPKPKECAKCKGYGHWAENCGGMDRKDLCYRCGQVGHAEAGCENPPVCFLCKEAGQGADHFRGSKGCQAYKEALEKLQGNTN